MESIGSVGPPALPGGRHALRGILEIVLLATAAACLGYVLYVSIDERAFQASQRARLEDLISARLSVPVHLPATGTATPGRLTRRPASGETVGLLEIPSAGIQAVVAAGDDEATLRRAVGWLPATALPGESGNAVVAGHRDTFFRALGSLKADDRIWLTTRQERLQYRVASVEIVDPDRLDVLEPTAARTLTLITCYPFTYIGSAPQRYVVRARQIEPVTRLAARR